MAMPETEPLHNGKTIAKAQCPRCGYDLRGAMELWHESCPIFGICSECGLKFEWADLLSPWRYRPRWNVEFPKRWIHYPINVPRTLICSFTPWRFFSELAMHHEFRPKRIAGYLIVLFCLPYVFLVVGQGYDAWKQYDNYQKGVGATMGVSPVRVVAHAVIMPLSSQPPGTITVRVGGGNRGWLMARGKAVPTTLGGRPAFIYPLNSPAELFKRRYRFTSGLSFWEVSHALILFRGGSSVWRINGKLLLGFLILATVFSGLCPLGFVLLPDSRRKYKVRREHIIRITLYSFVFLAAILIWIMLSLILKQVTLFKFSALNMPVRIVCLFILPLVNLVWWSVATDKYLKMPHAWGVGTSLVIIAYLLGPVLLMCVLGFLATIFA